MRGYISAVILSSLLLMLAFTAGCSSESVTPAPATTTPTIVTATSVATTAPTPTPEKETVYVVVTITVTQVPTPVPTRTGDPSAAYDLQAYNAWRYQSTSKTDGSTTYGPVYQLMVHLKKAPTQREYELYYQQGRRWLDDLKVLIELTQAKVPVIKSTGLYRAVLDYSANLTIRNESIRSLDLLLTDWRFEDAYRVSNSLVVNITNSTSALDSEVKILTG